MPDIDSYPAPQQPATDVKALGFQPGTDETILLDVVQEIIDDGDATSTIQTLGSQMALSVASDDEDNLAAVTIEEGHATTEVTDGVDSAKVAVKPTGVEVDDVPFRPSGGTEGQAMVFDGDGNLIPGNAGTNIVVSDTPPVSPSEGDLWIDTSS